MSERFLVTGVLGCLGAWVARAVLADGDEVVGYDLGDGWRQLPVELDATILSDEHAALIVDGEPAAWGFTGALLGLWVQDLGGDGVWADFDYATYLEH